MTHSNGTMTMSDRGVTGWFYVSLMGLAFISLYLLNYVIPLEQGNYTTRIWNWSEWSLAAGAFVVIILRWRSVTARVILLGVLLGSLSGLSYVLHDFSPLGALSEGCAVFLTFLAGMILFKTLESTRVRAFERGLPISLGLGVLFALPLAALNNLYFYLQNGVPRFQNVVSSALEALSPGIHEEVVYRYFVLAACLVLLKHSPRPRLALTAAIVMAVVPHSLLHLPDLFLQNPVMGLSMLVATSLLFGLPMAVLQVKRNLESAISFHWFIDAFRFLFGY